MAARRNKPVSYTHLDVYKRQVQAALLPFKEIESISTLAGYSLMTETEGANFGMGMINPVSYTHLDVYKRQMISRPNRLPQLSGNNRQPTNNLKTT